jgi:acyl-coenzyme A thioesterase PaaI-like protein
MGELSLEEAGTVRHRTVTWTDPLVGAALARDLSGLEYLRALADGRAPAAPIASLLGMSIVSTASGQITGPDGTLYAHATTTCLVFEPRGGKEH